jgi:predicted glycoside hydrolase/deacetylase ChbG (UPF0249 family)
VWARANGARPVRRLIINADGFGFTHGVNRGVEKAVAEGVVTSTSCVVNFPAIEEVGPFAKRHPSVSFGVHFNLSVGRPVADPAAIPTLVDERGMFWGPRLPRRLVSGAVDRSHIRTELAAQAAVLPAHGIRTSHWDGHQNMHLYPPYFFDALAVAREHGIERMRTPKRYLVPEGGREQGRLRSLGQYYASNPRRVGTHVYGRALSVFAERQGMRMADRLVSPVYFGSHAKWVLDTWLHITETLPEGTSEVYCHPGYVDETLRQNARYVEERELEVDVLTSPELKERLAAARVELASFLEI